MHRKRKIVYFYIILNNITRIITYICIYILYYKLKEEMEDISVEKLYLIIKIPYAKQIVLQCNNVAISIGCIPFYLYM